MLNKYYQKHKERYQNLSEEEKQRQKIQDRYKNLPPKKKTKSI